MQTILRMEISFKQAMKSRQTMHMLFPFRSVCRNFVALRPSGVTSLANTSGSRLMSLVRGAYYSVTSSSTMSSNTSSIVLNKLGRLESRKISKYELTKSSNPNKVPVNSRSVFITTQIRDPMHLSMSSTRILEIRVQPPESK